MGKDFEVPAWLKWMGENPKTVLGVAGGIAAIAGALQLFSALGGLASFMSLFKKPGAIASTAGGISQTSKAVGWLKNAITPTAPLVSTFGKSLGSILHYGSLIGFLWNAGKGIGGIVKGLEEWITTGQPAETTIWGLGKSLGGLITSISVATGNPIGILTGAFVHLGSTMFQVSSDGFYLEEATKKLRKSQEALEVASMRTKVAEDNLSEALKLEQEAKKQAEEATKNLEKAQKDNSISLEELLKYMNEENKSYADLSPKQKEVYDAYIKNEEAQKKLSSSSKDVTDKTVKLYEAKGVEVAKQKDASWASLMHRATLAKEGDSYDDLGKDIENAMKKGEISVEDARKLNEIAMRDMSDESKKTWSENIPDNISDGIDPDKYSTKLSRLKNAFSNAWNKIKGFFGKGLDVDVPGGAGFGGGGGGVSKNAKGAIYYPKLATGGIINYPNHGVVLGRAIAGEAGAEGVIPLTDSQAMETLGQAIGRYITVNANITTQMNGRTINRELKRINNEENFAMNGGY